jgi:hypothetical protein
MRLISHPAVLAAVALLAVNDHLLRRRWPSSLTGKLGDFCWLFFFPALLAALVTEFGPSALRRRPRRALLASMAATGLVFAGAKLVEPLRLGTQAVAAWLTGLRAVITPDPTDLVSLLAFVPLWLTAVRASERPAAEGGGRADTRRHGRPAAGAGGRAESSPPQRRGLPAPVRAYLAITLGVVFSLANSAAPDFGIDCLSSDGAVLQASSVVYQGVYASEDGGLTWQPCQECTRTCSTAPGPEGLTAASGVRYRYLAGAYIERSADDGVTWAREVEFEQSHEAAEALFGIRTSGARPIESGTPLTALIEPVTENAVFAMGHDGVLVHVAQDGRWEWVTVGPYTRATPSLPATAAEAADVLYWELRLALLLGLLAVATVTIGEPRRVAKYMAAALPWAAFLVVWFLSPALNRSGYVEAPVVMLLLAGFVAAVLHLLLFSAAQLTREALPRLAGIFVAAAVVFLLPYVLWVYGRLPHYADVAVIGLALGVVVTVIGSRFARRRRRRPW